MHRRWLVAAGAVTGLLLLGVTPLRVTQAVMLLLGRPCGWAWATVRSVPLPLHPLRAAMLNVTADYDQLAHLVTEFLQQPSVDQSVRDQFLDFMGERATRSYPRLEAALDWLLGAYKFLFPFLIISMAAKFSGGGSGSGSADPASPAGYPAATAAGAMGAALDDGTAASDASGMQLARLGGLGSQRSGSWPSVAPQPEEARRLALSRAIARAGKGGAAGGAADRTSPRGPDTPVEGARGAGAMLLGPATLTARGGGAPRSLHQQRTISSEILEGGL